MTSAIAVFIALVGVVGGIVIHPFIFAFVVLALFLYLGDRRDNRPEET